MGTTNDIMKIFQDELKKKMELNSHKCCYIDENNPHKHVK